MFWIRSANDAMGDEDCVILVVFFTYFLRSSFSSHTTYYLTRATTNYLTLIIFVIHLGGIAVVRKQIILHFICTQRFLAVGFLFSSTSPSRRDDARSAIHVFFIRIIRVEKERNCNILEGRLRKSESMLKEESY